MHPGGIPGVFGGDRGPGGDNSHDIVLSAQEVYSLADFAVYVPAGTKPVRGVIVALGGPETRAFVDGRPITDGSTPDLEEALQTFGAQLRALARDSGLAVLGSGRTGLADGGSSDALVLGILQNAADASGRPELSSAPLITLGFSSGGPEAFGLAERQAVRVAAFALIVPVRLEHLAGVRRPAGSRLHHAARARPPGGRAPHHRRVSWQPRRRCAVEPRRRAGPGHGALSDEGRTVLVNWITTAVGLRLPASAGGALRSVEESSGWLGNQSTLEIAPYGSYGGDPQQASWLPTAATARTGGGSGNHSASDGFSGAGNVAFAHREPRILSCHVSHPRRQPDPSHTDRHLRAHCPQRGGLGAGAGHGHRAAADPVGVRAGHDPGELFQTVPAGTEVPAGNGVACVLGNVHTWWTPLTSMFLHGGWLHLIGNMWFLWIFGNNVEDSMGRVRYFVFYILCGLVRGVRAGVPEPDRARADGGCVAARSRGDGRVHRAVSRGCRSRC